jgi:N-carbamoyl-L-amino-acid hydrolase
MTSNLRIDAERLWASIMESARIGRGSRGGLCRLALGDADREVRQLFARWVTESGYTLKVDQLGSMFARREGRESGLPPVLIGSHLDTQAAGGRFDGILGVLGGLEVLRTLDAAGIVTRRPIEVVNWTNEEGARFLPPMVASLAFAGKESTAWALARPDKDGVTIGSELERIGFAGSEPVGGREIDAYFELHIEQGPHLDAARVPVGVVTGGFPMRGFRVEVRGETSHVGPTPMSRRRNALVGAAYVAVAIDEIGWHAAPEEGKTTAARLDLSPNLPGILSEAATLYCDMRHPDAAALAAMEAELDLAVADAARRSRCSIEIAERWGFGGFSFDAGLIGLVREAATGLGYATMDLKSQAGHDAYHMAAVCPSVMIFTPCKDGISHNEAEDMTREDMIPGVSVLLQAVLARADR